MAVFVLDKHQKPLMPCSEKRARLLLEKGRAVIHRMVPLTIRLKDRLAFRAGGYFNIHAAHGLIQGTSYRFCTLIQRADGYGYALTKIASEKGEAGMGQAEVSRAIG